MCKKCGLGLFDNQNLRSENKACRSENDTLRQTVSELRYTNQLLEVRQKPLIDQDKEVQRLKETVNGYQSAFARQQEALEAAKKERAVAAQSLTHEFRCHAVTESSLEQERASHRDLMKFLHTVDVPRRADPNDNGNIGALWGEIESMRAGLKQRDASIKSLNGELQATRDELRQKLRMVEELSGKPKVEVERALLPFASKSSEEEPNNKQRKRARG